VKGRDREREGECGREVEGGVTGTLTGGGLLLISMQIDVTAQ